MPIHNFVDNVVNSTTLFVESSTPPSSKVYLHSLSFLLFKKEASQTSLTSNAQLLYNTAESFLLSTITPITNQLCLDVVSIYVGPTSYTTYEGYVYKPSTAYLATPFGSFPALFQLGSASRTSRDETSIFVKNAQDQELTWFVSTNLLEHTEVEIADTPDDNGGGQPTTGLKEFWA